MNVEREVGGSMFTNKMIHLNGFLWFLIFHNLSIMISVKTSDIPTESSVHYLEADVQSLHEKVVQLTNQLAVQEHSIFGLATRYASEVAALSSLRGNIDDLTLKFQQQLSVLNTYSGKLHRAEAGLTYTIWGRKGCPGNGSETVYEGYVGGSYYANPGGAAEFLCMPANASYDSDAAKVGSAYVYGAEYEYNFFGSVRVNDNVPCAVCHITRRTTSLMLPGRVQCYDGWTMEYHGWLAAGYSGDRSATEYICLDRHPEVVDNTTLKDEIGRRLYAVKSECGSLPCPPYEAGKSLSCVVCSI